MSIETRKDLLLVIITILVISWFIGFGISLSASFSHSGIGERLLLSFIGPFMAIKVFKSVLLSMLLSCILVVSLTAVIIGIINFKKMISISSAIGFGGVWVFLMFVVCALSGLR